VTASNAGLSLIVHRGTQQIGGSCIEIQHPSGERLILDAGRPLDAPEAATGLLPETLNRERPATVLISHPHQDHWGLIDELPTAWPIWTGNRSAELITISGRLRAAPISRTFSCWDSRSGPFDIGAFHITPILTDHSAFDAYMLLIEAAGTRILYTGDFRRHGRKSTLVEKLMQAPPSDIDVLLIEGTNLGSDKSCTTEQELEEQFLRLFREVEGRVFISWSAQNIDRTVTIHRAAKRSGRQLALDLYTSEVLDTVAEGTGLPRPGSDNLKVMVTSGFARKYRREGRDDFVSRMAKVGMSARALNGGKQVVMLRQSLRRDFERAGVVPTAADAFVYSLWSGYLKDPYYSDLVDWFSAAGARVEQIHTSGHASAADLRAFAAAVKPRTVVPIHGFKWDNELHGFGHVTRIGDGQPLRVVPATT
jgi:ribonuclease J